MGNEDGMGMGMASAFARYESLASSLPTCPAPGSAPYRKYGGFFYPGHLFAPTLAMRDAFVARPTDVVLATVPKSGTTWLKGLVFAIVHRNRHAPDDASHPLLHCSTPHDLVPFLHSLSENRRSLLDAVPSPRILAVHAPFSVMRSSVAAAESKCRIVYLCRDPKDVAVSFWHYLRKAARRGRGSSASPTFPEVFESYCAGVSPFGPVWDHMAEYWKESVARPEEVMFLRYESLKVDTVLSVRRLAEFLGCAFSDDEVTRGVPEAVVALCNIDRMKSVETSHYQNGDHGDHWTFTKSVFFRKGEVGDWKEHMTAEMARRLDGIVEEKLRGTGLSLVHDS